MTTNKQKREKMKAEFTCRHWLLIATGMLWIGLFINNFADWINP